MLNDVKLQGRLTSKPELRTTKSNKKVTSFTLAVERNGKDAGVDFIKLVAWNKTAELIAEYFDKGHLMLADANLRTRNVNDDNGKSHSEMEVVVTQVYFCDSKKDSSKVNTEPTDDVDYDDDEEYV